MWKVKVRLTDFLKTEFNPTMREFQPRTGNWEDWQAFERASEQAFHFLPLHIVKTLKPNKKKMYCFRNINPRTQKARTEQRDELFVKK
jgi:hypothetical protein